MELQLHQLGVDILAINVCHHVWSKGGLYLDLLIALNKMGKKKNQWFKNHSSMPLEAESPLNFARVRNMILRYHKFCIGSGVGQWLTKSVKNVRILCLTAI